MQSLADCLRFLWRRGPRNALRFAHSSRRDRTFDAFHGTDTGGFISAEKLAPGEPVTAEATCYRPTRTLPLRMLFDDLTPLSRSTFVDYGCGKGRVLLMAVEFGFKNMVGLEISPVLCAIAQRNLVTLTKRDPHIRCTIVPGDAAAFQPDPKTGIFYFYNPFSRRVMDICLRNIAESLAMHPRPHWVIFHHNLDVTAPTLDGFLWEKTLDAEANLFHFYRHHGTTTTAPPPD